MRLLLIEDEAKLASYLRQGLSEEGFVVETASNGVDGLHMATQGHYDLIVLDGMLPGIDGLGVLAALRHSRDTPVLMLTALGAVEAGPAGAFRSRLTSASERGLNVATAAAALDLETGIRSSDLFASASVRTVVGSRRAGSDATAAPAISDTPSSVSALEA